MHHIGDGASLSNLLAPALLLMVMPPYHRRARYRWGYFASIAPVVVWDL